MKKQVVSNWENLPIVLDTKTVSLIFSVTENTVARWVSENRLKAIKINRKYFFNRDYIKKILEGGDQCEI